MKIRRWSVAGLAAISLLTPVLTACGTDSDKPATTKSEAPAIPADPKEAVLASTKAIGEGNFRFTMSGDGMTGEGVVHLPSQSARMALKFSDAESGLSMQMDFIYVKDEAWLKADFGDLAKLLGLDDVSADKYLHLDLSKIKDDKLKLDSTDVDPASVADMFGSLSDVQKVSEGVYRGKLDLSKVTNSIVVDEDTIKALGTEAAALPFEAKLDAQGRLTEVTIKVPAVGEVKAHDIKVTYSDYGSATSVEAPAAGEVQEAPERVYEFFNN